MRRWLADQQGLQHAFLLPMLCYGYIVFYALRGSRLRAVAPPPAASA